MATYNRGDGTTRFIDRSAAKLGLPSAWLDGEINDIFAILNSLTLSQNVSEWAELALTPTYIGATQFSVVGDVTDIMTVNRKVRLNLTGTYVYSTIGASAFATGVTTITIDDAVLTASLNQIFYGIINAVVAESSLSAEIIPSFAAGDMAATNVQAALEELETEKIKGTDILQEFVISGLLGTDPGASLAMTTPAGKAWVNDNRLVSAGFSKTYTASKDTYDDISDADVVTHSEVANGAGAPAVAANSIRLQKVVTDGTEITSVTDLRELVGVISSPVVRDMARGLSVAANVTNPTYQVDVSADEIVLYDTNSLPLKLSSISETADITASGANGLDAGSEAASTNYYVWAIYDAEKRISAALISLSKTAPTMPSGYAHKALVGELYNDSGSDFTYINWWNGQYFLDGWTSDENGSLVTIITTGTTTIVTLDLGTVAIGDEFYAQASAALIKGGTGGFTQGYLAKDSGTAVIGMLHDKVSIHDDIDNLAASGAQSFKPSGIFRVTTAGTLGLQFEGASSGSSSTVSANGGDIYAKFLKKT